MNIGVFVTGTKFRGEVIGGRRTWPDRFSAISQIIPGRSWEEAGPGWAAQVERFFGWTFLLLRSPLTSLPPVIEKMRVISFSNILTLLRSQCPRPSATSIYFLKMPTTDLESRSLAIIMVSLSRGKGFTLQFWNSIKSKIKSSLSRILMFSWAISHIGDQQRIKLVFDTNLHNYKNSQCTLIKVSTWNACVRIVLVLGWFWSAWWMVSFPQYY